MAKPICSVEGCDTVARSKGMCNAHHLRWLRHGDPLYRRPQPVCQIDGCEIAGRQLCAKHATRIARYGDPNYVKHDVVKGTPEERFWAKVDRSNPDGCWTWTAAVFKDRLGYDKFQAGSNRATERAVYAHRFSWELHFGPITNGLHVLHKCDNPPCVRPDHLFLGTPKDNVDDMVRKGRARFWGR